MQAFPSPGTTGTASGTTPYGPISAAAATPGTAPHRPDHSWLKHPALTGLITPQRTCWPPRLLSQVTPSARPPRASAAAPRQAAPVAGTKAVLTLQDPITITGHHIEISGHHIEPAGQHLRSLTELAQFTVNAGIPSPSRSNQRVAYRQPLTARPCG